MALFPSVACWRICARHLEPAVVPIVTLNPTAPFYRQAVDLISSVAAAVSNWVEKSNGSRSNGRKTWMYKAKRMGVSNAAGNLGKGLSLPGSQKEAHSLEVVIFATDMMASF